jgi:hypothetical protein
MTLLYLLIIDFPKLDLLSATQMALYVNLGPKCQNLFPLVSDSAESSLAESESKLNRVTLVLDSAESNSP